MAASKEKTTATESEAKATSGGNTDGNEGIPFSYWDDQLAGAQEAEKAEAERVEAVQQEQAEQSEAIMEKQAEQAEQTLHPEPEAKSKSSSDE